MISPRESCIICLPPRVEDQGDGDIFDTDEEEEGEEVEDAINEEESEEETK